jgi:sortase A
MNKRKKLKLIVASITTGLLVLIFFFTLTRAFILSPTEDVSYDINLPAGNTLVAEATTSSSVSTSTGTSIVQKKNAIGLPARLIIPVLNIDAKVQRVGVGKSGSMAVPTNYTDVGWYRAGAVPGQIGSAVFDGHVDNGLGLPGVFKHLADISIGDEISVLDENGREVKFTVDSINIYDYKNVPTNLIFNEHDAARIRLITCDGTWVKGDKTYNQRLVVSGIINK